MSSQTFIRLESAQKSSYNRLKPVGRGELFIKVLQINDEA